MGGGVKWKKTIRNILHSGAHRGPSKLAAMEGVLSCFHESPKGSQLCFF